MKLQILIPTLPERRDMFIRLEQELDRQILECGLCRDDDVLIVSDPAPRGEKTIGQKRNDLLQSATADYVAFFDDDDRPNARYILNVMEGINKGVDACSLRGIITWDGQSPEIFEHSIKYPEWKTNTTGEIKYERNTNHLNVVKREIAQQFKFPETNFGEDHDWSQQLYASGLIKTEHYIDEVIYHYDYIPNK